MGIGKHLISMANDVVDDVEIRQKRENKDTLEKELYDVDFKLSFDKEIYKIFIILFIGTLLLFLKSIGKLILKKLCTGFRLIGIFSIY